MRLPNYDKAAISRAKILDYLLSMNHPHGRHKAVFFAGIGFSRRRWRALASALVKHATEQEVSRTEESRFGMRYVIEGVLEALDGGDGREFGPSGSWRRAATRPDS
jgi:hypothetical protein